MTPIRVLLADDHALFRQGVVSLLAAEDGFEVVGEAANGHQAVEMARALAPDVVLMDVSMPVIDGLTATRRIRAEMPGVRVVVCTVSDDEHSLFEALRCGANGFLPKRIDTQALCGTLRGVVRGEAPVCPSLAARLLRGFARRAGQPALTMAHAAELTAREKDVLEQVAQGRSHQQIATALAIPESTVNDHLRHVLESLHFASRV